MSHHNAEASRTRPVFAGRYLFDTDQTATMHARHPIENCPDLPLCWVIEVAQRTSEPVDPEGWQIAFDHEAVTSADYDLAPHPHDVTCSDCLEWMHA